jgi:hypothetical protein
MPRNKRRLGEMLRQQMEPGEVYALVMIQGKHIEILSNLADPCMLPEILQDGIDCARAERPTFLPDAGSNQMMPLARRQMKAKMRPIKARCFFDRRFMKSTGLHRKGMVRVECPVCHNRGWLPMERELPSITLPVNRG